MTRKHLFQIFIIYIIVSIFCVQSYALEKESHKAINEYIAKNTLNGFSLDSYLKNQLGIEEGIEKSFNSKKVWLWIGEGGKKEDEPFTRSANHFHNPLTEQGFSGLWGKGWFDGESALLWAQKEKGTQDTDEPDENCSWYDVRDYFYHALISTTITGQEMYFAKTFRGLGQLMHMVTDMSVPEHTRDDGHYLGALGFLGYEHYEIYVKKHPELIFLNPPIFFDPVSLLNESQFPSAPAPIANLFDTNQYFVGTNPAVTVYNPTIGLSEYTNANFLSPDTMFTSEFPYPNEEECVLSVDQGNNRLYLSNRGGGEQVDHLAIVSFLYLWRMTYFPQYDMKIPLGLDSFCYEEYASYLLPRAVGYSAALLDYFFRGKLEITPPEDSIYCIIDESISTSQYSRVKVKIRNETSNEQMVNEPEKKGQLIAVARYKMTPDEENFTYSVSAPIEIESLSSTEPTEFEFDFTSSLIPVNSQALYLHFNYKGTIGNEKEHAMAVGMKELYGSLEISPPENYLYSIIDGRIEVGKTQQEFTLVKAKVRNITSKVIQAGTIKAVAKYRKRIDYQPDLSADPPTASSREDHFSYSMSEPIEITSLSSTDPTPFEFDFTNDPVPVGITDLYLEVIFEGQVQGEQDPIILGGLKDISEPMHFTVFNSTDRFYLDGELRTGDEIRNDPALLARVDFNGDGVVDERDEEPYIDPIDQFEWCVAFYSTTGADPTVCHVDYYYLPSARYGRVIILSEVEDFNSLHATAEITPHRFLSTQFRAPISAVVNQEDHQGNFQNTQIRSFRGINFHFEFFRARYYPDPTGMIVAPWPELENQEPFEPYEINP